MNWLMSVFQRNLPAKIIALLVAIVLWFFIMNDQNPSLDGSFNVPLSVVNAPEGCKISRSEDVIKVRVKGPRSLFVSANANEFKAYVDLNGADEGKQEVKVQTVLPQGFELISASPETVNVTVDKIIQKKVQVNLIVTGAPAPGNTVAHITQSEVMVAVEGPRPAVEEVTHAIGYVGLTGNNADFSLDVPITPVNADGREVEGIKIIPEKVQASVQLARGLTKKVVSIKAVFADDLPIGYATANVRLDPSKIEIAGEEQLINHLDSISTEKISLAGMTKSGKKTVKLELPQGVVVTNKEIVVSIEITAKK